MTDYLIYKHSWDNKDCALTIVIKYFPLVSCGENAFKTSDRQGNHRDNNMHQGIYDTGVIVVHGASHLPGCPECENAWKRNEKYLNFERYHTSAYGEQTVQHEFNHVKLDSEE